MAIWIILWFFMLFVAVPSVRAQSCMTDTCMNGGTCMDGMGGVVCTCAMGWTGQNCEDAMPDACSNTPCQNNGSCMPVMGMMMYECMCAAGFSGRDCEMDACGNPNRCHNGGTCMREDSGNMYECICPPGFDPGTDCSDNVCNPNPCHNGGTCIPDTIGNFYNCSCSAGFSGGVCQNSDSPCMPNPCQNGGQCTPQGNSYDCMCQNGATGNNCQNSADDPCMPNPCQNGGQCTRQGNSYDCTCQNGATGNNCQNAANSSTTTIIIVVVVVVVVLIVVLVIVVVCIVKRSRRKRRGGRPSAVEGGHGQELTKKKKSNVYGIDNRQASTSESNVPSKEFPRDKLHMFGQIGSGSFAVVYKAKAEGIVRRGTNTTVAVKMLKESATPNDQSDFKKELQLYSMLDQHPNVLSMLGCCTDKDPMYIILEYVPHGNLQTYLRHIRTGMEPIYLNKAGFKEKKDLTPTEILTFASQVVRGMEYLASKQCIHRDLATRNILLGEGLICKVSDFGLARDVAEKSQYEMQSQGRVPVRWMAPESLLSNMYTSKSDVWSFGVLLWELVTLGSHPYPGMSSQKVINELKKGYRLPKPEHCSDDIYKVMVDCWQEKPEDRPDFAGLHTTIDDILADAAGYLEMGNLNQDEYVYLEPGQSSSSNESA
ncbi:fibroblast growth factor receptor-like isoform X3 [Patiria miniata]|uniref:Uncharacterized protein n=1 Tax=Patiria miniata TaxID=46514 RepID=A0A914AP59_PATMI|nr:fibroblast growth factor receptor-like isoform X3 [Patiria miniata]